MTVILIKLKVATLLPHVNKYMYFERKPEFDFPTLTAKENNLNLNPQQNHGSEK